MALEGALAALGGDSAPSGRSPAPAGMQVPAGLQAQRDADAERIRLQEVQNAKNIIAAGGPDAGEAQKSLDALNRTGAMSASRQPTNLNSPAANDAGPLSGALAALSPVSEAKAAPAPAAVQPTAPAAPSGPAPTTAVTAINPQSRMIPRRTNPGESTRGDLLATPYEMGGLVTERLAPYVSPEVAAGAGYVTNVGLSLVGPGGAAKSAAKDIPGAVKGALGSVGAAGADPFTIARGAVAGSSPELQGAVEGVIKQAAAKGKGIDVAAVTRHAEADSLPLPIRLTPGQATQDPVRISIEANSRGKFPAIAQRFNEQNKQLAENVELIRQGAAPDVYVSSKPEHGEIVIDAYKAKDAALNADISAKYKALEDANGGQFPLDSKQFLQNADAALHKKLLFDHVPPTIRRTMDRLGQNGMTFENFESMRTNLARIMRSPTADGNEKAAAGVIRSALEDLPMPSQTVGSSLEGSASVGGGLKELADAARAAAKARFDLIEKDPAYSAVVNGKASADHFIDKYVVGADLKNVQTMKENLAHDSTAQQTLASGAVNYLKQRAFGAGENFSQAGFNKGLETIRPKLGVLFDPAQQQQLETLGNVARYTQAQPRGSFVNNSNTAVSMMAEGAKSALAGAANVAAKGVPVGTWARKAMSNRAQQKSINEILRTGAGILKEKP